MNFYSGKISGKLVIYQPAIAPASFADETGMSSISDYVNSQRNGIQKEFFTEPANRGKTKLVSTWANEKLNGVKTGYYASGQPAQVQTWTNGFLSEHKTYYASGQFDVVIIGAGAAGLFCAGQAGQRGLKVLLIDHADKVAEKIRISGGGRCNFTNRDLDPAAPHKHFVGQNPQFCRSALSRYTPGRLHCAGAKARHPFPRKAQGPAVCDRSAEDIIAMLLAECDAGGVTRWQPCRSKI
jgi:hypothetical protein